MIKMQIVTSPGCECCEDVKKYVEGVKKDFPNLKVNIFDVTTSQGEDLVKKYNILAAPGIIINGRIEFTGETKEEDLRKKLTEIQKKK